MQKYSSPYLRTEGKQLHLRFHIYYHLPDNVCTPANQIIHMVIEVTNKHALRQVFYVCINFDFLRHIVDIILGKLFFFYSYVRLLINNFVEIP